MLATNWSARGSQLVNRVTKCALLKHNEEKATSTGILFSTTSIAGAIGPFLGGLVSQFRGYQPLMYLASGLCVSGLMIASMRIRWKA
jgi:MFS family permease